jgi:hypothetical protein
MASMAWADTTANLLTNQWSGISVSGGLGGQHPISVLGPTTSFGSGPFLDNSTGNVNGQTGQIIWSYSQATVSQIIAVNQALSGTGIVISGYNWGYELRNMNGDDRQGNVDTLVAHSFLKHTNGTVLLSATQVYNTKQEWNWHGGTVSATSPYALANVGQVGIQFTSVDSGFWAGYYGPQIRNVSLSLNYSVDQCVADPLSSPSCPGYQQALFTQQCSANPLSDPACPGYAVAYHDQQCSINPLHASTCPGYAQAYYTQQCTANPLYDPTCPGYAQAYFNQQCSANALYDSGCPGYAQAYFNQQCDLDPFYDRQCPGYNEAYARKNILNIGSAATATPTPAAVVEPVSEPSITVVAANTAATADSTSSTPQTSAAAATTSVTAPTSVSPAAVVSVVNPPAAPAAPAPSARAAAAESARAETKAAEQKQEQKKTERAMARILPQASGGAASEKAATERAQSAAAEAAEQAATATTIEAQQAAQNLVLGLMGYNPAFAAYQNSIVPDTNAATMARQYNRPTVDNRSALRQLSGASDRLHQEMVDQQYGRMP